MPKSSNILFIVFVIITLDMMGIGLIIPIVSPMLLHADSPFLSVEIGEHTRIILQGLALALYPLFQFFGAPLLGMLADDKGRKPMLLITLAGTAFGYFLATVSFWLGAFWIFLLSRAIDGFTGGNISIANAVVSDISKPEEKAKNFGVIGAAFGTGMVIGPFLGGVLSDSSLVSWFSYQTPFIFATFLSLANFFLVLLLLPETLKTKRPIVSFSFFTGFSHLLKAFSHPQLKILFTVLLCYISGFAFFTNFFQVFAIDRFGFGAKDIGLLFAYLGVCIIIAQGFLIRYIVRFYTVRFWIGVGLLGLAFLLAILPLLHNSIFLYPLFFFMAMCNGLLFANISALISNATSENEQGEIMGIKESLQAMGNALPAILASILGVISVGFPIFVAAGIVLIGFIIFYKNFLQKNKKR